MCSGTSQTFCNGGETIYGYTVAWSGSQATQICDTVLNRCSNYAYDDLDRVASQTVPPSWAASNFAYIYKYCPLTNDPEAF